MDELPKLAAELVALRVDAIVTDSTPATRAAMGATQTLPIVALSNDPVASGFVASLSRPGGNVTGISLLSAEIAGKRLQLLSELVAGLARICVLSNSSNPSHAELINKTRIAGQSLGLDISVVELKTPEKLEATLAAVAALRVGGMVVLPDAALFGHHLQIVASAAANRLPTLFPEKQVVEAGGLIAYGPSIPASFNREAAFVDKIFRGAQPADLPVEAPTVFELAINTKTAKTLGLSVPPVLLATADEVIE
jgi:putative tryptophan/tyrosine transport system substrate-binding protein